ncbi:MAG: hypothetical protein WD000_07910 [Thermodesulfobacteriota bacterium]
MSVIKVLTILTVLSFLSPFYYNFNENNPSDSCFSDESSLNIFEPITFTESADVLYAHGGGLNKCGCHFNRKTNECHCHRNTGCGCECQPSSCE